jgi:hypothetical protein
VEFFCPVVTFYIRISFYKFCCVQLILRSFLKDANSQIFLCCLSIFSIQFYVGLLSFSELEQMKVMQFVLLTLVLDG